MTLLFIAAVLPVIILCSFIYKKDSHREPFSLLMKIFIYGFLLVFPVLFVELALEALFELEENANAIMIFIHTFVTVAIVEEGFKWLITKKYGYDNKEFDEVYDIIVYAVFASLGFACVENIIYVFSYGLLNALLRALLSIPGHMCFAVVMGYFLAQAKTAQINGNQDLVKKNMMFSLLLPSLFHTIYDTLLAVKTDSAIILFFVFDITMVVMCFKTVNRTAKLQQNLDKQIKSGSIANNQGEIQTKIDYSNAKFCPLCGKLIIQGSNFCHHCGFKLK